MATKKIRLTLSGTRFEELGPVVDVDFNNENLEVDWEVSSELTVREYTVDVEAGVYNLDVTFKNDAEDRDVTIHKVEIAENGVDYSAIFLTAENTVNLDGVQYTLSDGLIVSNSGRFIRKNLDGSSALNPDFDPSQPRTDDGNVSRGGTYVAGAPEGSNPKYLYDDVFTPQTIYTNKTVTIVVTFN